MIRESFSGSIPTESRKSAAQEYLTNLSDAQIGDEIDRLLSVVEPKLREKWEAMIENLPLQTQVERLWELHQKRKEALVKALPENVAILQEMSHEFVETIRERVKDAKEIGRGDNGKVLADPVNKHIAYKFLLRPPIGHQNSLIEEASMQGLFHEIAKDHAELRVGVPRLEYFSIDPRLTMLAMERLDAVSVRDILDKKAAIPEGTDIDTLFDSLGEFVKELNEKHGLFHLDIRPGNVMIHKSQTTSGHPRIYLIDMGMSKHKREVRSVVVKEDGAFVQKVDKVSDHGSVQSVRKRLKQFVQE